MPGVTEQEIAQAKQMNLYQYMQLCEPDNFKPEGPGQFRHKGHSSLTFAEDGSWTYFKTKATGRTALNYLIAVEGVSFVEAVREINRIQGGVRPSFQPVKTPPHSAEKKPAKEFKLPRPDKNNYAATAYLRKRCIHPNVLTVCKQKKILYQTSFKYHPNCVFVGRDGNGEPKGGSLRGCSQIKFRRDIPGSKKIYPFYIEAAANADTVEVYEAPMDWEELYGIVDGIKCRATGSGMTEEELRQLFASLNIDATTARGQVVAFALSCQGKFVYAQPSSLRGGPGSPSVGINLDCSSFVQYCYWAQNLPFSAGSTAAYRNVADLVSISPSEVQPGDLRVVYASGGEQGHVQMALGGGAWIECCYGYGVAVNMYGIMTFPI